jgi:hypothetical protein
MLVRAAVTLFWAEAEEVWVVAAAPVRARTTTRVRIASFMELAPWGDWLGTWLKSRTQWNQQRVYLASLSHAAGVWIIGRAGRDRQHAGPGHSDLFCRGRGGGGLCGGDGTGEDEDDNERANDMFHSGIPLKLYSRKKISLDKPDEVTIGYKLV